ncbi:phosphoribosylglycinamide formyltransferase-1 [Streptomyces sp. SAI-208]|uniref:formyltransferase family protein n=1 Tax=Streptomyces sp. SAI-208 TaxID=2940550 RepID=UPI002476290B|nr:formyltransferase family protein [Streptomyces sp. SAI-208]MDH6604434.1 phosphoribosylglycinamide formyltransferase-1 [Streptomyces sp. SAI-208]
MLLVTDRSLWAELATEHARNVGFSVRHLGWEHGDEPVARGLGGWRGDWIVGFKADYILSAAELRQASAGALNFHPAPPDLRGVGTYGLALEEKRSTYGVTCHHMVERVDFGQIVDTAEFPISEQVDQLALHELAAAHLYALYVRVISLLRFGIALPSSDRTWSGPLHTWHESEARVTEQPAT